MPKELPESTPDIARAWEAEVLRRVGEIERGEVATIPAAEVWAELEAKYDSPSSE